MSGDDATATARNTGKRAAAGAKADAAGAALAVVAVAGTALGALLLRPEHSAFAKGRGPFGATAAVVLIAAACVAAGLFLSSRYRARLGYQQDLPAFEQRLADVVRVALVVAALAVPLLLLAMHRYPAQGPVSEPTPVRATGRLPLQKTVPPPPPPPHHSSGGGFNLNVPRLLLYVGIGVLVAVLLVAGYRLWRQLRDVAQEPPDATYGEADDRALADAVDSGRRALLGGGDARAAVIACYAAMETSLARSGVARRASDSPQDLLERAAGSGLLTGLHATGLTALFREARYSTHPMDDTHRDRASAALTAIAAQLAAQAEQGERAERAGGAPGAPEDRRPTTGAHR